MEKINSEKEISIIEVKIEKNISDLEVQELQIERVGINILAIENTLDELIASKKREFSDIVVENEVKIASIEAQIEKINKGLEFSNIFAPVDGVIQGISQNTVGGNASPSQILATIVPDDTPLVIEAYLSNRDIGFVYVGQEVSIKFDTFSFQRYGLIDGEISRISPDAVEIENVGTVYLVYITSKEKFMNINGNNINFSPGMTVTTEIKTGTKKIISFFLDPLIKYKDESLNVR